MNTEFCMKCGGKAEYTLRAPNFCPSCGEPFNKAGARPTPKSVPGEDVIQQTLNECRSAREPSELSDG